MTAIACSHWPTNDTIQFKWIRAAGVTIARGSAIMLAYTLFNVILNLFFAKTDHKFHTRLLMLYNATMGRGR